jgi:ankyrin repeat protein
MRDSGGSVGRAVWTGIGVALCASLFASPSSAQTASAIADAARIGDRALVRKLISRRLDVNAPQADGTTALHYAAHHNDAELTGELIAAGARVAAQNRYGVTPLVLASAQPNSTGVIERLLRAGADPNTASKEGETALADISRRVGTGPGSNGSPRHVRFGASFGF